MPLWARDAAYSAYWLKEDIVSKEEQVAARKRHAKRQAKRKERIKEFSNLSNDEQRDALMAARRGWESDDTESENEIEDEEEDKKEPGSESDGDVKMGLESQDPPENRKSEVGRLPLVFSPSRRLRVLHRHHRLPVPFSKAIWWPTQCSMPRIRSKSNAPRCKRAPRT
jgi:hypothetical protein